MACSGFVATREDLLGDGRTNRIRVRFRERELFFSFDFPYVGFGLHFLPLHCTGVEEVRELRGMGKAGEEESTFVEGCRIFKEPVEDDNSKSDNDTRLDVKTALKDIVESFTEAIERRRLPPSEKTWEHFIALGLSGEGKTVAQIHTLNVELKDDCIRFFSNLISLI
jgi:hypothetical protein